MTELTRDKLNQLRRFAGVPQDYAPERKQTTVTEDIFPGMSQILRGGKHKFYLVTEAKKDSDLGDVLAEVDFRALTNIIRGAGDKGTKNWELFPHTMQNDALNLARERLAGVTETVGYGMQANNPDSVPHPNDDEIRVSLEQQEEDDFEPATNICPDCEGGEHPPAVGKCKRCGGEGEVFESKKVTCQTCDGEGVSNVGNSATVQKCPDCKGSGKVLAESKKAKPDFADIDDDGDKKESAKKAAKETKKEENEEECEEKNECVKCNGCEECEEECVCKEEQEEVKECACGCDPAKCKCPADCKCGCNAVEEQEEVKECACGCDPAKCKCPADCKCGCNAVKESMGYHTDDNYPLTHVDSEQPHNVDASYETIWDKPEENEEDYQMNNDDQKIKVPAKILSELKRVIGEVTKESEKSKPRDEDRASYYEDTAEALQIVHDELSKKTVQGLKQAQYLSQRMMNVQRALMPDTVWKFLVDGGVKRSLKSYMNAVKEPVTGKPFDVVDIETLNKNTHTQ